MSWEYFSKNSQQTEVTKLVLTGSSTVAPLVAEIAKRFESLHPDVRIDVQTGGSSRGVNDVRSQLSDIGIASRSLKSTESELLNFTIALDGISIILNKAEGHSTLELFLHYFSLQNTDVKPHVIIGDNQQGIKTVAGNLDAIGYVSVGSAEYEAEHQIPIKLLPLEGVTASVENVRNQTFPLSRPLNLITREPPTGVIKEFIDFAGSDQVNDLINAQYFVPVTH